MMESKGYAFGIEEGEHNVVLDNKEWGNAKSGGGNLRLYFSDLASGKKFYLSVFAPNHYAPLESGPNFKDDVNTGDRLTVQISKTRTGNPKFLSAKIIS